MSISLFLGEAVTGKRGRRGLFCQPLTAVGQVSDGFAGAKISRMKQMSKFIVLFINILANNSRTYQRVLFKIHQLQV